MNNKKQLEKPIVDSTQKQTAWIVQNREAKNIVKYVLTYAILCVTIQSKVEQGNLRNAQPIAVQDRATVLWKLKSFASNRVNLLLYADQVK